MATLIVVPMFVLMALICYRLLTGQISTAGLFGDADGAISPERIQMFAISTLGGGLYILNSLRAGTDGVAVPDMPAGLVALIGGSHGLYLLRKWIAARDNREPNR